MIEIYTQLQLHQQKHFVRTREKKEIFRIDCVSMKRQPNDSYQKVSFSALSSSIARIFSAQ